LTDSERTRVETFLNKTLSSIKSKTSQSTTPSAKSTETRSIAKSDRTLRSASKTECSMKEEDTSDLTDHHESDEEENLEFKQARSDVWNEITADWDEVRQGNYLIKLDFVNDKTGVITDEIRAMQDARNKIIADSGVSLHSSKVRSKPKAILIKPFKCPKQKFPMRKIGI